MDSDCTHDISIFDTRTYDRICTNCGIILHGPMFESIDASVKSGSSYKRWNHINQILRAWSRECDPFPIDIMEALVPVAIHQKAHLYQTRGEKLHTFANFTKQDISNLIRTVILPYNIQYKCISKRGKVMVKLSQRKQYSLRWWMIKDYLVRICEDPNYKPDIPDPEIPMLISHSFRMIVIPFHRHRHVIECDNPFMSSNCKNDKCRYAMLNSYYVIVKLMKYISCKRNNVYLRWKSDFPQISSNKIHKIDKIWTMIEKELKWPGSLLENLRIMFPHFKHWSYFDPDELSYT